MPRIFYGWWIALASLVVYAIGGGFGFYALTVFFGGFEREYGWNRTELSGAISLTFLISGLLGPVAGRAADKRSAKGVIAFGAVATGLSFVFLAFTTTVWQLYVAYIIMAIGRTGLNFVPLGTVLANWFVKKRGMAMAIMRVGAGLGGFVASPFAAALITGVGLVSAFWIIAVIVFVGLLPVTFGLIKQKPSDLGLLPDGDKPEPVLMADGAASTVETSVERPGISLKESLRVPSFWLLAFSIGLFFTGEVAVLMHAVPFFGDRGFTTDEAARVVGYTAVVGIGGSLLWGFLADNVLNGKYVLSLCCALMAVSLILLWFANSTLLIWAFAMCFGLASAGILTVQGVVVGESFGIRSFGEIFGVLSALTNFGTVFGPVVAGYIFDSTGSYQAAFATFFLLAVVAALLVLFVRPLKEIARRSVAPTAASA